MRLSQSVISQKKSAISAIIAGVVLSGVFMSATIVFFAPIKFGTLNPDTGQYLQVAAAMLGWPESPIPGEKMLMSHGCHIRSPGYPALLALALAPKRGHDVHALFAMHGALWLIAGIFFCRLISPIAGPVGAIVGLGSALIGISSYFLVATTEWVTVSILIIAVSSVADRMRRSPSTIGSIVPGVSIGWLISTRTEYLIFVLVLIPLLVKERQLCLKQAAQFCCIAGLVVAVLFNWKSQSCGVSVSTLYPAMALADSTATLPCILATHGGACLSSVSHEAVLRMSPSEFARISLTLSLAKITAYPWEYFKLVAERVLNVGLWYLLPMLLLVSFVRRTSKVTELVGQSALLKSFGLAAAGQMIAISFIITVSLRYALPLLVVLTAFILPLWLSYYRRKTLVS